LLHSDELEKLQGHQVLAIFGAFRLLLGGAVPTRKIRNLSRFLEVCRRIEKALHTQGFFAIFV